MMRFDLDEIFSSIEKAAGHLPSESLSTRIRFGEHKSRFLGKGHDFYQIREYDPERDSVTDILWQLRTSDGKIYVRDDRVTKEFVVVVLADLSSSMAFCADYPYKARMLLETVGNTGQTCVHGQDPMGFVGFADDIIFDEPPGIGEDHTYYLLEQLYDYFKFIFTENIGQHTRRRADFYKAFNLLLNRYSNNKCLIIVLSDFVDCEDLADSSLIDNVANEHEVVFLFLDDVDEFQFKAPWGYLRQRDIETGKTKIESFKALRTKGVKAREQRENFRGALELKGVRSMVLEYGKHLNRLSRFFEKLEVP